MSCLRVQVFIVLTYFYYDLNIKEKWKFTEEKNVEGVRRQSEGKRMSQRSKTDFSFVFEGVRRTLKEVRKVGPSSKSEPIGPTYLKSHSLTQVIKNKLVFHFFSHLIFLFKTPATLIYSRFQ